MDFEQELKKFELSSVFTINFSWLKQYVESSNGIYTPIRNISDDDFREIESSFYALQAAWKAWREAKAQAVPEQDQQVWATNNLTWKDIAFRALSCKVLKTTQNWVHVKNIACVGSTTASLICRKLGVDPDGTKFELIEAQEQTND